MGGFNTQGWAGDQRLPLPLGEGWGEGLPHTLP
jgi:hypothetical protein